jgi:hypothetical protein
MNTKSLLSITLAVFISCAMMIAPAKADVWNQQTKVTFSQPVEVPGGRTLPAGTYWCVLANSVTDRNIVKDCQSRLVDAVRYRINCTERPTQPTR